MLEGGPRVLIFGPVARELRDHKYGVSLAPESCPERHVPKIIIIMKIKKDDRSRSSLSKDKGSAAGTSRISKRRIKVVVEGVTQCTKRHVPEAKHLYS